MMQGKSAHNTGKRQKTRATNKACKHTMWHALQVTASNWHPHTNRKHVQSKKVHPPRSVTIPSPLSTHPKTARCQCSNNTLTEHSKQTALHPLRHTKRHTSRLFTYSSGSP
jgi:hypothetical protein